MSRTNAAAPPQRHFPRERAILGAAAVMVFLIVWEGFSRGWWAQMLQPLLGPGAARFALKPIFISSPTRIAHAAYLMFLVTGEIWKDIGWSALAFALGLALAFAIGIPLGLAAGWYRRLSYAVEPFLTALNATPQVAFLPLLILWVGTGLASRVLIILLLAVLPIAISALGAVRIVDARLIRVARSFSAGDWRLFTTIVLPTAVPFLLAGARLAVGRGMIGIVVGEIFGSAAGIGMMINQAGSRFEIDKVFVGVLVIAVAGVGLVELIRGVERRVDAWRPEGAP